MRVEIHVPGIGKTVQMGVPIWFSDTEGAIVRRAPLLGEHTREIAEEAAALASAGRRILRTGADDPGAAPLAGVRVVELNAYTAGPYAGGLLASFGADVVRVEPLDGDPTRQTAWTWFTFNGRKRAANVNLRVQGLLSRIRDGIAGADVLLENNRPGVLHRLGVGYEDLAETMARLIFASSYGWGKDGPRANAPSFDILVQARSGWLSAQGDGPEEPVYTTNLIADYGGALQNVFMVAAALYARERTARGQWVMSILGNSTMVMQAGDFIFWDGKPDPRPGGRSARGIHPAYRLYRCAGGSWLFLACTAAEHWERLAQAARMALPRWEDVVAAGADEEPAPRLADWFADGTREDRLAALDAAGVPAGPVHAGHDLTHHAQLEINDVVVDYVHPVHGRLRTLAPIARFEGTAVVPPGPDPGLGEHTRELLLGWGASPDEIDAWGSAGAIVEGGPVSLS